MLLKSLVAGAALLAVCASAQATTYDETFVLTASQAGTSSTGFGAANVNVGVDTATHTLSYNIIYTGLSSAVTAIDFHGPAAAGATAPVTVNVGAISGLGNPSAGSTTISQTQVNQIIQGLWYLNIDTANFPSGEVRGQLPAMSSTAAVPEPAALSLLGLAAAALTFRLARRR